ncbi:Rha family transcriptional regulator [Mediterraneibacter gnavus]|uniref:Rha family transcriptional regulator n=1 Tax=Mediterraneibacter gnavus TaxID=33038 RepID=UPI00233087B0|nr:Rha family transcriptional regulator [Mediterraneibacter gnavus]MDB8711638.1 Rha family transcriptional regulator [Mediterraneibacter gnavus]MDB8714648.1 Rha family transcriptional regulator [Mediterraneibacter gnavus]
MNNLTVFEQNGQLLTDSREVAMMVQMNHSDLIRKIKGYMKHLNESNFALVDFFIESTYRIQREK